MSDIDFLAHLQRESEALIGAARHGDLTARAPSCPDWTVGDLIFHLTEVQYFFGKMVCHDYTTWRELLEPRKGRDENLVATFELFRPSCTKSWRRNPNRLRRGVPLGPSSSTNPRSSHERQTGQNR